MWEPTEVVTVRTDADQRRLRQLHKAGKLAVPEQWLNRDDNVASFGTGARVMLHGAEAVLTEAQARELGITVAAGLNIDKLIGPVVVKIESHLEDLLAARLLLIARDGYAVSAKELSDLRLAEFNPDQARDERGRWTDNPAQSLGGLKDKFLIPTSLGVDKLVRTAVPPSEFGFRPVGPEFTADYDRFAKDVVSKVRVPLEEAGFKLNVGDVTANMKNRINDAAGLYNRDDHTLRLNPNVVLTPLNDALITGKWDTESKEAMRTVVHELLHAASGAEKYYPGIENPWDVTAKLRLDSHKMVEEGMVELLARQIADQMTGPTVPSERIKNPGSYHSYVEALQPLATTEEFLKLLQEPRAERLRILGERVAGKLIDKGIIKPNIEHDIGVTRFNANWNEQFTKRPDEVMHALVNSPTRFYKALDRLEGEDLQEAYALLQRSAYDWQASSKLDNLLLTPEERKQRAERQKEWEKMRKADDRRVTRSIAAKRAARTRAAGRRRRAS